MALGAEWRCDDPLAVRCRHPRDERFVIDAAEFSGSLGARLERVARRFPERWAVCSEGQRITFGELTQQAGRMAATIAASASGDAGPIGILAGHGAEAILATWGAIFAGRVYVPLDPKYPIDRLRFMLDDVGATLLIADASSIELAAQLTGPTRRVVALDELRAVRSPEASAPRIDGNEIVAVYYTSGSTGRPKGIAYSHRYLLHNMWVYGELFQVAIHDRWSWLHSSSYAAGSTDIFCPLLHGAAVCAWDVSKHGTAGIGEWARATGVTIFNWMPTPFRSAVEHWPSPNDGSSLRLLVFGGEPLFARDADAFRQTLPRGGLLANRLGTSETGVFRLALIDRDTRLGAGLVPAGFAVPDKEVVILDEAGRDMEAGALGEIGVRSEFLPPGYWNLPELTSEKFRGAPGGGEPRTYLTGDLGSLREDGRLDYVGRRDSQVKIRGHRVELGEVEQAMRACVGVREAAARPFQKPDGELSLAGYYVVASEPPISVSELRRQLRANLPAHLVPSAFVQLDALPRNANQKVDRASLPEPAPQMIGELKLAPRSALERHLVELWTQVLQVESVGVDEDFFALGGDSLAGMRMIGQLQSLLTSTLHIPPLFEHATVETFAAYLVEEYGAELQRHFPLELTESPAPPAVDRVPAVEIVRRELSAFPVATGMTDRTGSRNPSAIFVLAPSRSGTTLLRVILAGHSDLFAPAELHLLSHDTMDERRNVLASRLQRGRLDAAIQALLTARGCSLEEAEREVRDDEQSRLPVRDFYLRLQSLIAPRRLVDKTPGYVWHASVLERAESLFHEPLYIHLCRHPLATILSYEEARLDQLSLVACPPNVSVREFAESLWVISQQNILDFLAKIPARRQTRVSFETLVRQPRETVMDLCRFLEIEFQAEMLEPYGDSQARMTAPLRPGAAMVGDPKFHQHRTIASEAADRWREVCRTDFLQAATWDIAARLGYSRHGITP